MRIASTAERENRIVSFGLRRYQVVLHVETEFVEIALGAQVEADAARRVDPLDQCLAQLATVKAFQIKMRRQNFDHLLTLMRIQMNKVVICH